MPKSKDKTKGAQKRQKTGNSNDNHTPASEENDSKPGGKRKKIEKRTSMDGIQKSKQLKERLKRPRTTRATTKRNELRICGNGKPMPPLSELEKMYEDSDSDEESVSNNTDNSATIVSRCNTPEPKPELKITEDKLLSPKTLKNIANKVMDIISNVTVNLDDEGPPPPVIPPKKQKKTEIPYIVGCKERLQVPWAPKSKFCVGDPKYGPEPNSSDEDTKDNTPGFYISGKAISKSIFNAKSDEIAEQLKQLDKYTNSDEVQLEGLPSCMPNCTKIRNVEPTHNVERNSSPDSNKTLPYEFPDSPSHNGPRSFSPLPSTSRDRETILKNDQLFNKSLKCESSCSNSSKDDIEILEVPCETIIIDDNMPERLKTPAEPMDVDVEPSDDDCCVIVESEGSVKPKKRSNSPIEIKDDFYSTLDLTQGYDDNDVCEIIDVDDVISQNKAVLDKYSRDSQLDSVIFVEPSSIPSPSKQNTSNKDLISLPSPNKQNISNQETTKSPSLGTMVVEALETLNQQTQPTVSTITNRQQETENRNEIADIVTHFFEGSNSNTVSSTDRDSSIIQDVPPISVDRNADRSDVEFVRESSNSTVGRIVSWISSLDSLLRGRPADRSRNRNELRQTHLPRQTNLRPQLCVPDLTHLNNSNRPLTNASVTSPVIIAPNTQPRPLPDTDISPRRSLGDCPICMDGLSNRPIASTLCGHIFCMECIKAAIKSNGKKCPTCRKSLKGVGYHQLFL